MAGAAALVAAWLTAATGMPQVIADPMPLPSPTPAGIRSGVALNLADEVDRLRERLTRAPVPPETLRNPFEIPEVVAQPKAPVSPVAPTEVTPPAAAAAPAVTLVGIASHATPDGQELTVILLLTGDVVLARIGDALPAGGLRVVDVTASDVRLEDESGGVVRLALP